MQRLQVDRGVLEGDDELERTALVLEEEVFRVAAGNLLVQVARLRNGERGGWLTVRCLICRRSRKANRSSGVAGMGGKRIWSGIGRHWTLAACARQPHCKWLHGGSFRRQLPSASGLATNAAGGFAAGTRV